MFNLNNVQYRILDTHHGLTKFANNICIFYEQFISNNNFKKDFK